MGWRDSWFRVVRVLPDGRRVVYSPGGRLVYGYDTYRWILARARRLGHEFRAHRVFDPGTVRKGDQYRVVRLLRDERGAVRRRVIVRPSGRTVYPAKTVLMLLRRAERLGHEVIVQRVRRRKVYPNRTHFSPNFRRDEFASRGVPVPAEYEANAVKLCGGLERLRAELGGAAVVIINGYRTPEHNAAVGGASRSTHLRALGADIHVPGKTQAEVVRAAARVGVFARGGIGAYGAGGIHVDARGWVARWGANIWRILRRGR